MRKIIVFALLISLLFVSCAYAPSEPADPTVATTIPTSLPRPDVEPTDLLPTEPPAAQPSVTEPDPTEPVLPELPTLPDVGEDPGGFGPIF